jgi:hypothetical protein
VVAALAQRVLSFDEPEPFLYHDPTRRGYVSLWTRELVDGRHQTSIQLSELGRHLDAHVGETDRYISAGVFYLPNRRTVSLTRMPMAFADLDTYKVARLQGLSPEAQLEELLYACSQRLLPEPSVVVFSGRGLQLKWLLAQPVPRAALPRWAAVQRALNGALADFGADPGAIDASRVLRLEGSVSSRSGEVVRVLHRARTPTMGGQMLPCGVAGYDFDVLAKHMLPVDRIELAAMRALREVQRAGDHREKAKREAVPSGWAVIPGGLVSHGVSKPTARPLIPSELAWHRLEDLRTLATLRGHQSGLPAGQRNTFVFLGACFLAQALLVRNLREEVETLVASVFAPDWRPWEVSSCVSAVISRAEAAARHETVEFEGKQVDPRYRFKNETLVNWLHVTSDEEKELLTIISSVEARRRNTERHRQARRASGSIERAHYLQQAADKRERVRALKDEGLSNLAISRQLRIPRSTVIGYLKD